MRIIICENYEDMSKQAAKLVISQVTLKPASVLGLATGSTPIGMYDKLIEANKSGELDLSKVTTFNLDEYYPLSADNDQSYHYFMNEHLFSKTNIRIEKTHVPDGEATDPDKECEEYDAKIEEAGGIDLQILGIGQNGHIGFNEPDDNLNTSTHLTKLTDNTIEANARFFEKKEDVPTMAITMGIASILKSRKIILMANGAAKHRVVKALMTKDINTDIPATMLKVHPDVVLICDREAFYGSREQEGKFRIGIDLGGTNIKVGIVDDNGNITHKVSEKTNLNTSCEELVADMANLTKKLVKDAGYEISDIKAVGIGSPGSIDNKNGTIFFANNLNLRNAQLVKEFKKHIDVPVNLENDANAAAYGEYIKSGDKCNSFVFVTLGTGVGGGIVLNGKIYRGFNGIAGELGHTVMVKDGIPCSCGKKGCWEVYASATALINQTKEAIEKNPATIMAKAEKISGRTAFEAAKQGDKTAQQVVDNYITWVAEGISSIVSLLQPEKIVIGGGISNEGENLLKPIREYVAKYTEEENLPSTEISIASLYNDAGIIGAAFAASKI